MQFKAEILSTGKSAAGIVIPDAIVEALGPSRHPTVRVTIGRYTFRSSIAKMGGAFMLPVTAETRAGAGVSPGDKVELEVEIDTGPREVLIPPALAAAFDRDPGARQRFETLSHTNKRRLTIPIEAAKSEDTRQRRVVQAVASLLDAVATTGVRPS